MATVTIPDHETNDVAHAVLEGSFRLFCEGEHLAAAVLYDHADLLFGAQATATPTHTPTP